MCICSSGWRSSAGAKYNSLTIYGARTPGFWRFAFRTTNEKRTGKMNVQTQIDATSPRTTEHFDVLIAGAGISGVGAAYHLTTQCPGTSFVALEAQKTFGGCCTTHRYPGIRSDSDLHTFGYRFKPWTSAPIASAAEILKYM